MIYAITGNVFPISGNVCAVNVSNTGLSYEVVMVGIDPLVDGLQTVYIHTYYPEQGAPCMYGFLDRECETLFKLFLSVPGCGPSRAAVILNHRSLEDVATIIATKDLISLESIPAIGPKTAKNILSHLEDQFPVYSGFSKNVGIIDQSISALIVLGYKNKDALTMVLNVTNYSKYTDVSALVRESLVSKNAK